MVIKNVAVNTRLFSVRYFFSFPKMKHSRSMVTQADSTRNGFSPYVSKREIQARNGGKIVCEIHSPTKWFSDSEDAVLLVNGWTMGKRDWGKAFFTEMCRERPCIAYDNRGIGESAVTSGPYTIDMLVEDCENVIERLFSDTLPHQKIHIIGTSMGGMIALQLALERPDLVKSLVLCGATAGGRESIPAARDFAKEFFSLFSGWNNTVSNNLAEDELQVNVRIARRFLEMCHSEHQLDPQTLDDLSKHFVMNGRKTNEGIQNQLSALGRFNAVDKLVKLSSTGIPTLIVHGKEDNVIPFRNAEIMHEKISQSQLLELPNVGHLWQLTNPEVVQLILGFFTEAKAARL